MSREGGSVLQAESIVVRMQTKKKTTDNQPAWGAKNSSRTRFHGEPHPDSKQEQANAVPPRLPARRFGAGAHFRKKIVVRKRANTKSRTKQCCGGVKQARTRFHGERTQIRSNNTQTPYLPSIIGHGKAARSWSAFPKESRRQKTSEHPIKNKPMLRGIKQERTQFHGERTQIVSKNKQTAYLPTRSPVKGG